MSNVGKSQRTLACNQPLRPPSSRHRHGDGSPHLWVRGKRPQVAVAARPGEERGRPSCGWPGRFLMGGAGCD